VVRQNSDQKQLAEFLLKL
jgi:hypothetical protein